MKEKTSMRRAEDTYDYSDGNDDEADLSKYVLFSKRFKQHKTADIDVVSHHSTNGNDEHVGNQESLSGLDC